MYVTKKNKTTLNIPAIEIINNKARHNLIDAKCRWRSDQLDGARSFWELLGQTKLIQIRQGETQNHQGAITHEVCCSAAQFTELIFLLFSIFICYRKESLNF
jgi:hypothetical protein